MGGKKTYDHSCDHTDDKEEGDTAYWVGGACMHLGWSQGGHEGLPGAVTCTTI